jgi:hypothetical protein
LNFEFYNLSPVEVMGDFGILLFGGLKAKVVGCACIGITT